MRSRASVLWENKGAIYFQTIFQTAGEWGPIITLEGGGASQPGLSLTSLFFMSFLTGQKHAAVHGGFFLLTMPVDEDLSTASHFSIFDGFYKESLLLIGAQCLLLPAPQCFCVLVVVCLSLFGMVVHEVFIVYCWGHRPLWPFWTWEPRHAFCDTILPLMIHI